MTLIETMKVIRKECCLSLHESKILAEKIEQGCFTLEKVIAEHSLGVLKTDCTLGEFEEAVTWLLRKNPVPIGMVSRVIMYHQNDWKQHYEIVEKLIKGDIEPKDLYHQGEAQQNFRYADANEFKNRPCQCGSGVDWVNCSENTQYCG
jgi:hypothetical protein